MTDGIPDRRNILARPAQRTGNGEAAALRTWLELGQWETAPMPRDLGRHQLWTRKAGQSNPLPGSMKMRAMVTTHLYGYRPAEHRSRREIDLVSGVLMGIRR